MFAGFLRANRSLVSWVRSSPCIDINPDANLGTKNDTRIKDKLVSYDSEIRIVAVIVLGRISESGH